MSTKSEPTVQITVYIAGDVQAAKDSLRRQCWNKGLCVTVTATTFIYTAGVEDGVAVGLVNYPRFPTTLPELKCRAREVAELLMVAMYQRTALIVCPDETIWITRTAPGETPCPTSATPPGA